MAAAQRPARPVLAIEVGGTKLAAAIVDPAGRLLIFSRVPTPAGFDAEVAWSALDGLLGAVLQEYGEPVGAAGIGCGGPMRWPAGEVSPINLPAWRDFPLRARVADRLGGALTRLHNDAICIAIGEHWTGAGRGVPDLLGIVVGTGVGGGLVLADRIINGATGNAGHVGHVVVDPAGPTCGCGGRGCLEAYARGPAVLAWAQERGWAGEQGSAREHSWVGEPGAARQPTGAELAAAARAGNAIAQAAYARAGRALGIALASAVAVCDVAAVAIGGGVIQAGPPLWEPLAAAYDEHARLGFSRRVPVVPAAHGQAAGLIGAAALVLPGLGYWAGD